MLSFYNPKESPIIKARKRYGLAVFNVCNDCGCKDALFFCENCGANTCISCLEIVDTVGQKYSMMMLCIVCRNAIENGYSHYEKFGF